MPDRIDPEAPAVAAAMTDIQKLDPGASVRFNGTAWFMAASIDVIDDAMAGRVSEFCEDPALAVLAYHEKLAAVRLPQYLATRLPRRRHWLWNGEAFCELPSLPDDRDVAGPA